MLLIYILPSSCEIPTLIGICEGTRVGPFFIEYGDAQYVSHTFYITPCAETLIGQCNDNIKASPKIHLIFFIFLFFSVAKL